MGHKRITLRIAAVVEVVDGKIAAWREYYGSVDLARQLGVDPSSLVENRTPELLHASPFRARSG